MRYLIFISLLLFSLAGMAQSSDWTLFLNKTKLLSASTDSLINTQLPKGSKGTLKFDFPHRNKGFKRTVMIMNEQRNTLLQKEMKPSCSKATFDVDELLSKTGGNPFVVYIVDIPSDPAKAMLVRMAPVAICKVEWK